jgi:hypothetical protein
MQVSCFNFQVPVFISEIKEGFFAMGNKIVRNMPTARGAGRPKGAPNKSTALLKDAILQAAELAGDKGGMVNYLLKQAHENPIAFMGLMGKVLPLQVVADITQRVAVVTETVMTPVEWEKQWSEHHNDNPRH